MGNVVPFRPRDGAKRLAKTASSGDVAVTGGADILLFLGVRYERHTDEQPRVDKTTTRKGRSRKRA
jgi:hypothetical protein